MVTCDLHKQWAVMKLDKDLIPYMADKDKKLVYQGDELKVLINKFFPTFKPVDEVEADTSDGD